MATQDAAALPSAQVVGNAFVDQYYHILHQSPELVFNFYQEASILSRPDVNGVMTTVTNLQAINEKIISLNCNNYRAEINNADAQDSYNNGVFVQVTGSLTGKDNVSRKFAQSFFLAPQEKGYFVLNDIFRYVEDDEQIETYPMPVSSMDDNAIKVPLTPNQDPIPVEDHPGVEPDGLVNDDRISEAEVYDPSDHDDAGSVIEEEPQTHLSQNESDLAIDSDLSAAQEEKKSYASIVKVSRVTKNVTPARVATNKVHSVPSNTTKESPTPVKPSPAKPSPVPEATVPTIDNAANSNNVQEEGVEVEGHSIYVRNLPLNATLFMLEEEFKRFGPIKHDGIQVRSNKLQGFCFGFVEFESMVSMNNAIDASPLPIGNRQAVVEEKKTTTRVSSGGRGKYNNSGRAGFRNDGFRGRGAYGGGRGYGGRGDFRNQGEFSGRSRGGPAGRNVEAYQRVERVSNGTGGGQNGVNRNASAAAAVSG
ncbi:nuclear transport factor 2-like [Impatiens glandulifera]|uniref:nuclear transport factor 2-like n=1 Tax=Impatiens glandulifera TaxID=253017 RepID=UPI001FB15765|nr:nuclear transport factor 2-like [Impatiens glandulifera]